jgi:hypothetical protein
LKFKTRKEREKYLSASEVPPRTRITNKHNPRSSAGVSIAYCFVMLKNGGFLKQSQ